ncbi:uncharacterized protein LOC108708574 [Xenopus laevis]|uniref:Uncharacterized protein LOC108708574 n=1 Tax=Xenopus laevis TaxID=8355 RepID=A0A8J0UF61_XENLA|nr:uncharacterized protein LOC108708574 [Xenopus laevis]
MRVLGLMVSSIEAVPFAQIHLRPLQSNILTGWKGAPLSQILLLLPATRDSLLWWLNPNNVALGQSLEAPDWTVMSTDASLQGWGATWNNLSRSMVPQGGQTTYKHSRALGSKTIPRPLVSPSPNKGSLSTKQQFHHSRLHQPARGNPKQTGTSRGPTDSDLGGVQLRKNVRHSHSGSVQHKSRLPQLKLPRPRGMGTPPGNIYGNNQSLGPTPDRPHGVQNQLQSCNILLPFTGSSSSRSGCNDSALAVRSSLCLSTSSNAPSGFKEDQAITSHGNRDSPPLAQKDVVLGPSRDVHSPAHSVNGQRRSAPSGSHSSPQSVTLIFFFLQDGPPLFPLQGIAEDVIATMLRSLKSTSSKAYRRVWRTYWNWCRETHANLEHESSIMDCNIPRLLSFLQRGLQLGLKLSSLKVQVSALSVLLQSRLALEELIRTFLQGVPHITPPFRSPTAGWDLNIILEALLHPPFEPLGTISEEWLTRKVVFLVAISSARRVSEIIALSCDPSFLVFHRDKAVLRTAKAFLPKVVSSFHINQEIVFPSLCPEPKNDEGRRLHNLDVVKGL